MTLINPTMGENIYLDEKVRISHKTERVKSRQYTDKHVGRPLSKGLGAGQIFYQDPLKSGHTSNLRLKEQWISIVLAVMDFWFCTPMSYSVPRNPSEFESWTE